MLAYITKTDKCDTITTIADKLANKSRGYSLELIKELVWKRKESPILS
jgi:hypothetical protein